MLEGLSSEERIAELCSKEEINQNPYYCWSKEFLEAGKKRLPMKSSQLREMLAELMMENRLLRNRAWGWGGRCMRYAAVERREIIRLVERSKCRPIRIVKQPISAIIRV